jgi:hypothetical protein
MRREALYSSMISEWAQTARSWRALRLTGSAACSGRAHMIGQPDASAKFTLINQNGNLAGT